MLIFNKQAYILAMYHLQVSDNSGIPTIGEYMIFSNHNFTKCNGIKDRKVIREEFDYLEQVLFHHMLLAGVRHMNKTKEEIIDKINNWKNQDHSYNSLLFIVFMSHGTREGILCIDGSILKYNDVFEMFSGINFPAMKDKPKVFLFNCCRTERNNVRYLQAYTHVYPPFGIRQVCIHEEEDRSGVQLTDKDMLAIFSTMDGYVSMRHSEHGSLYLWSLSNIIRNHGIYTDLHSFFRQSSQQVMDDIYFLVKGVKAVEKLTGKRSDLPDFETTQCPNILTTLTKTLCIPVYGTTLNQL